MSVGSDFTLPGQPAEGNTRESALAGNGYYSPHSEYHIRQVLQGAAGGGTLTMTCHFDPRWSTMIAMVGVRIVSVAVVKDVQLVVQVGEDQEYGTQFLYPITSLASAPNFLWTPQPQILFSPGAPSWTNNIILTTPNVDSEDVTMSLVLYNFAKDASKVVPLSVLNNSLPRGTTQSMPPTVPIIV